MSKFKIVAPVGGFGNHLRWLALLDPQFSFRKVTQNASHTIYHSHKQIYWPDFEDYIKLGVDKLDISAAIKSEMIEKLELKVIDFSDLDNKIESIRCFVYNTDRTWHNWLFIESRCRDMLAPYIDFAHYIDDSNLDNEDLKIAILCADPELALRSYLKFNPNLNNTTQEGFKTAIEHFTKSHIALPIYRSNVKVLKSDDLYQPNLDKVFYNEFIDFFGLEDCYSAASTVHKLWFDAQHRSEIEFVRDITKLYNKSSD